MKVLESRFVYFLGAPSNYIVIITMVTESIIRHTHLIIITWHGNGFANDDITATNPDPWGYDAVIL